MARNSRTIDKFTRANVKQGRIVVAFVPGEPRVFGEVLSVNGDQVTIKTPHGNQVHDMIYTTAVWDKASLRVYEQALRK